MPRKYKKSKTTRKTRRRRRSAFPRASIGKSVGFPRQRRVRMRYVDQFLNGVMSVGSMYDYKFNANSIFDPNVTGIGHQPLTHDTWESLYNHYRVVGAVIRAEFNHAGTNNLQAPCAVGVYLSDDSTAYTDWTTMVESGRGSTAVLKSGVNNNAKTTVCKAFFSARKFFGAKYLDSSTQASFGAGPTDDAIFHVWMQPQDQATTVSGSYISVAVTIDYIVDVSEPKDLGQS